MGGQRVQLRVQRVLDAQPWEDECAVDPFLEGSLVAFLGTRVDVLFESVSKMFRRSVGVGEDRGVPVVDG